MARHRVVLRGGTVLTMDPHLGNLPRGDVLIEDGVIAAVAPDLSVDETETVDVTGHIVAPGMIDTHRHTWQTQLRALCADWTLADYLFGIRLGVSPAYLAEDVHLGNHLGALDALNSGVTTILDFSHCNNTPEHADAAITGLRDAGSARCSVTASSSRTRSSRRTSPTTPCAWRTSGASPTPTSRAGTRC